MAGLNDGTREADIPLAAKLAFLRRPQAYSESASPVTAIETHLSWVFMTDDRAYKLKKPVRYDFLDFRTLAARKRNCEEELRLNRRLAADVYLETVALTRDSSGALSLGGAGEPVDFLVKMRRLPSGRMLDRAIVAGTVSLADVGAIAAKLAEFFASAPSEVISADAYRERFARGIDLNRQAFVEHPRGLPEGLAERVCAAQGDFLACRPALFDERARAGHVIEGHGDLRPEHICLAPPFAIIDCLEFDRSYRILDPVDELAFLAVECAMLGASWIEAVAVGAYRTKTGDKPSAPLVHFYKSYRAALRARIALWHLRDAEIRTPEKWPALARRYLQHADALTRQFA